MLHIAKNQITTRITSSRRAASSRTCPVDDDLLQEVDTDIEIEDSRHANGAEKAHECGLLEFFDLVDFSVHGKYNWDAAKEHDQDPQKD